MVHILKMLTVLCIQCVYWTSANTLYFLNDILCLSIRYTLPGLLPTKIVKNFEKLSTATYILCKENLCLDEVNEACQTLLEFANEFESIYGKAAVTMNIHLLKHYKECVLNCGPSWSYALFAFENNIGVLKKFVFGETDVLEQIAKKYAATKIKIAPEELSSEVESSPMYSIFSIKKILQSNPN